MSKYALDNSLSPETQRVDDSQLRSSLLEIPVESIIKILSSQGAYLDGLSVEEIKQVKGKLIADVKPGLLKNEQDAASFYQNKYSNSSENSSDPKNFSPFELILKASEADTEFHNSTSESESPKDIANFSGSIILNERKLITSYRL